MTFCENKILWLKLTFNLKINPSGKDENCQLTASSSMSSPVSPSARGYRSPADQIQHLCKRHRQMGFHASPRGGAERPNAALRSAAGPRSRPHHEEPRGPDRSGPGHGMGRCKINGQFAADGIMQSEVTTSFNVFWAAIAGGRHQSPADGRHAARRSAQLLQASGDGGERVSHLPRLHAVLSVSCQQHRQPSRAPDGAGRRRRLWLIWGCRRSLRNRPQGRRK